MTNDFVTMDTFRKALGMGRDRTYTHLREGRIKAVKLSRRWVIPVTELRDFPLRLIAENETV